MCEQNASCLAKNSELGSKILNKIWPEIIQKPLKQSLEHLHFQKFPGKHAPRPPQSYFCFSISFKLVQLKKNVLKTHCGNYAPSPLKTFVTPPSAVYQHFFNEGSKFCSKVAVKGSLDYDAIL